MMMEDTRTMDELIVDSMKATARLEALLHELEGGVPDTPAIEAVM